MTAIHAGPASLAAPLRDCLGMGADRLIVLDMPAGSDPLPAIARHLADARPALVLTGDPAETGEGSGMAPVWLAEGLSWPLVARVVGLEWAGAAIHVTQAWTRGRRRMFAAAPQLLATVDRAAPPAPFAALGRAWRGTPSQQAGHPAPADDAGAWPSRPARVGPRALAAPGAGSAEAATRREMIEPDPVAAADAILDLLERESLIAFGPPDIAA